MSKKAEERALECYPVYEFFSKDINRRDRNIFLQGYEQAEKELKLTWEDMKAIKERPAPCPAKSKNFSVYLR